MEKLLAMHNIPKVYADKGMYQEALRRYQALIGLYEEKTMIDPFSLATVYLGMGGKKTVIDPFSLAAVYLAMANVFADAKQYEKALDAYQKGLELIPYKDKRLRSHALTNLGWLLSLLERDDKAEIALKKALQCNQRAARAYLQLGNLYGRYPPRKAETVACYKRYLALEPHSPFRQELLARIQKLERELDQEMNSGKLDLSTEERIRRASSRLIEPEKGNLNDYDPP
jgi:tetratricopeptide (TPR) repeat protein